MDDGIARLPPAAHAAVDADDVGVAHGFEIHGGEDRPKSAAAIEQDLGVEGGDGHLDVALDHALADVAGAGDVALGPFALFADVEDDAAAVGDVADVDAGFQVVDGALGHVRAGAFDQSEECGAVSGHGAGYTNRMRVALLLMCATVFPTGCTSCEVGPPVEFEEQAWLELCRGRDVGDCIGDGPLQCETQGPPAARCEVCTCAGGAACIDGGDNTVDDRSVCVDADIRDLERDVDAVRDDLDDDVYLALFDTMQAGAPLSSMLEDIKASVRQDARTRLIVVGREVGDRADIVIDAIGGGDIAIVDDGDPCAARAAAAANATYASIVADMEVEVDVGDIDSATSAGCVFEGSVPRCVFPHRAPCLARGGARPQTVLVVDDDVFLPRLDDVLLRTLGRRSIDVWDQRLDEIVGLMANEMLSRTRRPDLEVSDGVEVRVTRLEGETFEDAARTGDVYVAWLPRFSFRPPRSTAFRALWRDGPTRQFMTTHDVAPGDCVFNVDGDGGDVFVVCTATDGAVLDAVVSAAGVIIDVDRTAP